MTVVGTRCTHHPLEFHGCHDVVVPAVAVLCRDVRIPDLESSGDDDRTDVEDFLCLLVGVVDCALETCLLADSALVGEELLTVVGVNECDPGNCLLVRDVDCFPCVETELELVRDVLGRTLCYTVAASGTFRCVNVPGLLLHSDLEISCGTIDLDDLCVRQSRDVRVACNICHFRRENTSGTVIRRECLVQTAHLSTSGGVSVYEVDMDVPSCKIQRCLDTCDSSTDNQR